MKGAAGDSEKAFPYRLSVPVAQASSLYPEQKKWRGKKRCVRKTSDMRRPLSCLFYFRCIRNNDSGDQILRKMSPLFGGEPLTFVWQKWGKRKRPFRLKGDLIGTHKSRVIQWRRHFLILLYFLSGWRSTLWKGDNFTFFSSFISLGMQRTNKRQGQGRVYSWTK